jgi:microcystin-dependent protein
MSSPYVGEIRMFAGNFAPSGWAFCNGQLLAISENPTLFDLIGTTYGGDGQTTFALPDFRSRVPIHQGVGSGLSPYVIGQSGGVETVTLTVEQMPAHSHEFVSAAPPVLDTPTGSVLGSPASGGATVYAPGGNSGTLNTNANVPAGGSAPHTNLMPYLCTSFIISLFGIFPSQN